MDAHERTAEIMKIFVKLKELNLGIANFSEFAEFRQICNRFIRTGEAAEGEIGVLGTKRIIVYELNAGLSTVDCYLKYDPSV
jgi:hypothetical protein